MKEYKGFVVKLKSIQKKNKIQFFVNLQLLEINVQE